MTNCIWASLFNTPSRPCELALGGGPGRAKNCDPTMQYVRVLAMLDEC